MMLPPISHKTGCGPLHHGALSRRGQIQTAAEGAALKAAVAFVRNR
jgi:hypothetical protein